MAFLERRFRTSLAGRCVEADTLLFSTGIVDSFGVLELIAFLEETFGVDIDPGRHELTDFDTVGKIATLVARLCSERNPDGATRCSCRESPSVGGRGERDDKILRQTSEAGDDRHGLPAAGVTVKAEAVPRSAERGPPSDGRAVVHEDIQMAAPGPDRDMDVVAEGVNRSGACGPRCLTRAFLVVQLEVHLPGILGSMNRLATFGYGVSSDQSMSVFLECALNEPAARERVGAVDVVNLGYHKEGAYAFRFNRASAAEHHRVLADLSSLSQVAWAK